MDNNPKSVRNPVQHLNEHADFITSQPDAGEADKRHKKGGKKGEEQKETARAGKDKSKTSAAA